MRCLGVGATARASVGVYNDASDIDALVQALHGAREIFGLSGERDAARREGEPAPAAGAKG
jgi:hypothetical protein